MDLVCFSRYCVAVDEERKTIKFGLYILYAKGEITFSELKESEQIFMELFDEMEKCDTIIYDGIKL